jgi:Leucine-rich repeat (LRR) protein
VLSLSDNLITEISGLKCLVNLKKLDLANNQIKYIPKEIMKLESLECLNLSGLRPRLT